MQKKKKKARQCKISTEERHLPATQGNTHTRQEGFDPETKRDDGYSLQVQLFTQVTAGQIWNHSGADIESFDFLL